MLIETKRIALRTWHSNDRAVFAAMGRNSNVMEFLGPLLNREQSDAAVNAQIALIEREEPAFWAIERLSDQRFMGFVGVKKINFDAHFTPGYEIGWRLGEDYWGKGYATEGAKAALKYTFSHWPMERIYSFTVPANIRSQAVMRKIGMSRVGNGDFEHPNLSLDNPLSRHVLYHIDKKTFSLNP